MGEKKEKVSVIMVVTVKNNDLSGAGQNFCPVYFFTISRQIKRCGD
ncbi:hypothetical protein SAMD00020551_3678 [Mesobacillus selenatarsenatis SF-1]|uniref:Uncharacterized protein n=1 Tax=Mesobacillus selenatarsenatis (strain DSM 18680 / JCM 14380 / FERM P-15431 / SF-1) TaxID=1321606 RepID=A0A0A8XBI4_MESS1|nr:hypothetical protein SAMD00020551_3678 [Mesobacillus selenatarsenatis SF-1]